MSRISSKFVKYFAEKIPEKDKEHKDLYRYKVIIILKKAFMHEVLTEISARVSGNISVSICGNFGGIFRGRISRSFSVSYRKC
jgi:hypothetical protein